MFDWGDLDEASEELEAALAPAGAPAAPEQEEQCQPCGEAAPAPASQLPTAAPRAEAAQAPDGAPAVPEQEQQCQPCGEAALAPASQLPASAPRAEVLERPPTKPEKGRGASLQSTKKKGPAYTAPGTLGGTVSREALLCAGPKCRFLVHSRPEFGGYCCNCCAAKVGHGPKCQGRVAPPGLQKADESWMPPEPKHSDASVSITHEYLRRQDENWKQLDPISPDTWPRLRQLCRGPFVDRKKYNASQCLRMMVSKNEEHMWTLDHDPNFYCELTYEGIFPMGGEFEPDTRIQVLTLCLDEKVSVLDFHRVHVSRQVRRRAKRYTMTIDAAFDDVLLGCVRMHGEAWLYRGYRWLVRTLSQRGYTGSKKMPFGVHSFELWDSDGQLIAGDLGYVNGGIYSSMSGFREQHTKSAGEVQLVLTAALLRKVGFDWMSLGQVLKYKETLGARVIDRQEHLDRFKRDRDRQIPLRHEPIGGQDLLDSLYQGFTVTRWRCVLSPRIVARQWMSMKAPIAQILSYGTEIESYGEPIDGWVKLKDGGGFARVHHEELGQLLERVGSYVVHSTDGAAVEGDAVAEGGGEAPEAADG